MMIVLVFLLGMPLVAVPQVSEWFQVLLLTNLSEQMASHQQSASQSVLAAADQDTVNRPATVTMLASDRSQARSIQANPAALGATIDALKAQFVDAGVSYMVLEQIGTDSTEYRFQFDVPLAVDSAYRKRFHVLDKAPDEAMRRAWMELQQWRVAAREPAHLGRPTVILR